MPESKIIVYGTDWCGDCYRSRLVLKKYSINYTFINIDRDKDAEKFVITTNKGMRRVPTIVFEDGTILVEPSDKELAQKLGVIN